MAPCPLAFPWEQLTHFLLGPITTMNEGLPILAICPHLKSLELTLLPVFPVNSDDDPFVHSTSQRLHLSTAGNLAALLDKVTLPALRNLSRSELHGASPYTARPLATIPFRRIPSTFMLHHRAIHHSRVRYLRRRDSGVPRTCADIQVIGFVVHHGRSRKASVCDG